VQLAWILDGDHALVRWNLIGEGSNQRRLADAGAAADDDIAASAHQRTEQLAKPVVDGSALDELVEGDVQEAMATDGHARPPAHRHHRKEAAAVGQVQVKIGSARVETVLGHAATCADLAKDVDQFRIGSGHRIARFHAPSRTTDPHAVVTVDVDVLDHRVVEVALESSQAEERVHDRR